MTVLVAYATRHGATRGIAERIAETLRTSGLEAEVRPAGSVRSVSAYDAVVLGSAAYLFHWLKDARALVKRERGALATRPVWLFSSGPLGTERLDAQGRDQLETAVPREMAEMMASVGARDHAVFFGAYEAGRPPVGLTERVIALMPAARNAMPAGDFRDWPAIETWAAGIARELRPVAAG